jgi:hypothetical protein
MTSRFRMCRTTGTLYDGGLKDCQDILDHHSGAFTLERYRKPVAERAAASEEVDAKLSAKLVPIRKGAESFGDVRKRQPKMLNRKATACKSRL